MQVAGRTTLQVGEEAKNWQKSTRLRLKTGYVSAAETGQQDRKRTKTCSLCAAA